MDDDDLLVGESDEDLVISKPLGGVVSNQSGSQQDVMSNNNSDEDDEEEEDENDEDDDDDDVAAASVPDGMYDPSEFEHLNVGPDVKDLFTHIMRYTPQSVDLETKFKPFIPEYIPAVGDIDAFLKVVRPDGETESLGLTVLDEPSAKQSDPSILDLQLRAVMKQSTQKTQVIKKIDNGEKNGKSIDKWIKDISDLHRSKPPPTVHYSKPMPDLDTLMQEWPPEFEQLLKGGILPHAGFDSLDTRTYIDVICALLDIPVYKSRIQSLHLLFSLYSVFKQSQHFNNQ